MQLPMENGCSLNTGMTLRHITARGKTVSIVNRFGYCASNSALLELETAMCDQVAETKTTLPAFKMTEKGFNVFRIISI